MGTVGVFLVALARIGPVDDIHRAVRAVLECRVVVGAAVEGIAGHINIPIAVDGDCGGEVVTVPQPVELAHPLLPSVGRVLYGKIIRDAARVKCKAGDINGSFGIDGNRRAFLVGREEASVPCGPLEGTGGIVLHRQQVHRGLRAIAPAGEIDVPRGIRRHIIHNIEAHAGAIVTDGPGPGFIETILDDEIAHG